MAYSPYSGSHCKPGTPLDLAVNATAHQLYWELSRTRIPAGFVALLFNFFSNPGRSRNRYNIYRQHKLAQVYG